MAGIADLYRVHDENVRELRRFCQEHGYWNVTYEMLDEYNRKINEVVYQLKGKDARMAYKLREKYKIIYWDIATNNDYY